MSTFIKRVQSIQGLNAKKIVMFAIMLALALPMVITNPAKVSAATSATINFGQSLGERSPNVFGGSINVLDISSDIDSMRNVGINFARRDAYLSDIVPATTLAAYQANMAASTGVANPATWDWSKYAWVNMYKTKGLKIMLIMSYNVSWNSQSGNDRGVPIDWNVYKDIVKKIYLHFEADIDYVEIYNEPNLNGFLDMTGTGSTYPTGTDLQKRIAAYKDIYINVASAIRNSFGAKAGSMPLGGPSSSRSGYYAYEGDDYGSYAFGEALMQDAVIKPNVNFLSYHAYHPTMDSEDQINTWRNMAAANGKPDMPIYITEWNFTGAYEQNPMNNESTDAIAYIGERVHNMIKNNVAGTGYFAFNKYGPAPAHYDFYSVYANGSLTPKMSLFRLMSKKLGLGDGTFVLKGSSWVNGSATVVAGGATTATGNNVAWVVNTAASGGDNLTVNFNGLKPGMKYTADLYEASQWNDSSAIRQTFTIATNGSGNGSITFWIPYKAIVGVKLTDNDTRTDLSLNMTASADSFYNSDPTFAASKAVDGTGTTNDSTRWASASTAGTHWLKTDLGSSKAFNEVAINWETAYGINYTIDTSPDNSVWTTKATITGNASSGKKVYNIANTSARYVRINSTSAVTGNVISLYSVNVYNDIAAGKTATADSYYNNDAQYVPGKSVDVNETTRWASGNVAGTHWTTVDLGSSLAINTVRINWEAAYSTNYTVQTSPDNINWTTKATISGNASAGWKLHSFTSTSARYVKVNSTTAVTGNVISTYSINVY